MIFKIILFVCVQSCFGFIQDLNDWDYDRMPPLFALDEYPKCLRRNGTYCLVTLHIQPDSNNEVSTIIQEYSNYRTNHYNHSIIDRGICVTRSCEKFVKNNQTLETEQGLEEVLAECLNDTIFKEYGLQTNIREVLYCNKHNAREETNVYPTLVTVTFIGILLINAIGSLYDLYFTKNSKQNNSYMGNPYILGFSIRRNWNTLVAPIKESSKMYTLRTLHGIRVLCMSLAVVAHTLMIVFSYIDNPHDVEKFYDAPLFRVMVTGSSIVQIFFTLSAFLQGYKLLEDEQRGVDLVKELPKSLFLRWWRLTPVYAVCLAFIATWLERLSSGPLWSTLSVTVVKDCRRYWWLHLLYLNNYVADDAYCMFQTWHVATDMQLYIVGLVTMAVLRRWRARAMLVLLAAGLVVPAVTVWIHDLDAKLIFSPETFRTLRDSTGTYDLLYAPAHTNIICFAAGLLASMLCHHYQKTGLKINQYKFYTPFYAWLIPGIIALFLTGWRYHSPAPAPLVERALYTPLMHAVLSVLLIVGIVGMVMGYDAGLCSFFGWHGFAVLARLSYCTYLVHFPLLHVLHGSRMGLHHASFINTMIYVVGVYGISTVLALMMYLFVEAPCDNLAKTYISRGKRKDQIRENEKKREEKTEDEKLQDKMTPCDWLAKIYFGHEKMQAEKQGDTEMLRCKKINEIYCFNHEKGRDEKKII